MIPVFLVPALLNVALSLSIMAHLYQAWRARRSFLVGRFLLFYALFAGAWIAWSAEYLDTTPYQKATLNYVGFALILLAGAALIQIPFRLHGLALFARLSSLFLVSLGAYFVGLAVTPHQPMVLVHASFLYMWVPSHSLHYTWVAGTAATITVAVVGVTFYSLGHTLPDTLRHKSRLLVSATAVLFAGATVAFFVFPNSLVGYLIASFLVTVSLGFTWYALSRRDPNAMLDTATVQH